MKKKGKKITFGSLKSKRDLGGKIGVLCHYQAGRIIGKYLNCLYWKGHFSDSWQEIPTGSGRSTLLQGRDRACVSTDWNWPTCYLPKCQPVFLTPREQQLPNALTAPLQRALSPVWKTKQFPSLPCSVWAPSTGCRIKQQQTYSPCPTPIELWSFVKTEGHCALTSIISAIHLVPICSLWYLPSYTYESRIVLMVRNLPLTSTGDCAVCGLQGRAIAGWR